MRKVLVIRIPDCHPIKAMFTLYRIVKRSVAETDPVQCEQAPLRFRY